MGLFNLDDNFTSPPPVGRKAETGRGAHANSPEVQGLRAYPEIPLQTCVFRIESAGCAGRSGLQFRKRPRLQLHHRRRYRLAFIPEGHSPTAAARLLYSEHMVYGFRRYPSIQGMGRDRLYPSSGHLCRRNFLRDILHGVVHASGYIQGSSDTGKTGPLPEPQQDIRRYRTSFLFRRTIFRQHQYESEDRTGVRDDRRRDIQIL